MLMAVAVMVVDGVDGEEKEKEEQEEEQTERKEKCCRCCCSAAPRKEPSQTAIIRYINIIEINRIKLFYFYSQKVLVSHDRSLRSL